ncbi:hypothetical protein F0562_020420 [Nyssa sinensis]|uniref:RING-type E3 ubiquitin transferase n=1 Tax=Nyssa sinensis TaxID=561372 RepID=A0A5J5BSK9_9ASTE|nr:hypothetical protein F0562_020420 [Nyssa sinensis]
MRRRSQTETEETRDDFLDEDHGPVLDHPIWYIRTIGLQPSIINAITVCKYKRGDGLVEGTDCSVCLSEFQEDETLRLLPKCNHAFHIPCIDTWLRSHTNCPMCRAGIVSNSPPPEQNVEISVLGEVIQEGTLENSTESGREREDGACELRIGIEEEDELLVENETKRQDVANSDLSEGDEVQPRRRSVSLDSSSASMISLAIANALPVQSDGNSGNQLVKMNESNRGFVPKRFDVNKSLLKLMGTSSIGRSLPRGPISMKRSLSCSGKVLLSKYSQSRSRNRNSVLPQVLISNFLVNRAINDIIEDVLFEPLKLLLHHGQCYQRTVYFMRHTHDTIYHQFE